MDVYLYVERDSPIHRIDPRPKFLLVVATILLAVAGEHPLIPAVLQGLALAGVHVAGAWRSLARVRFILVVIFVFSTVVWTAFSRGETHLAGPLHLESLMFGAATGLKLTATITASVVWLSTTRNEEIAAAFVRLGVPYRVAFAFSAALRLVPTFVGAGMTIAQAQRARGLDLDAGGLLRRMRSYLPLVVPVFAAALRSAGQQAMALEARGFGAQRERTRYLELRMRARDWVLVLVAVAASAAAIWIGATGASRIGGLIR